MADPERKETRKLPVGLDGGPTDRYRILRELGRGGMGVVYLAEDQSLSRQVALKVLREDVLVTPEDRARFEREIALSARFEHPHIVRLYDSGGGPGIPTFFTMEYVPGQSLEALLAERRPRPADALRLLLPLCRAVAYAHAQGVLHRDIKPANVLVDTEGKPRLNDFGLAALADHARRTGRLTESHSTLGTPCYMSPEQASGDTRALDVRTDIYGLGAVLYETLTGRPPFDEGHPLLTLQAVIRGRLDPPRRHLASLNPEIETICLKALEHRPEHRYPSAEALADDIGAFLGGRPIAARPPGPWRRLAKWAARNRAASTIVAVFALGTMVSFAGVYRQTHLARSQARVARLAAAREIEHRRSAELARRQAEESRADFDRLADVQHLHDLLREAARLWPPRSHRIAAYSRWIERAELLAGRQAAHRTTVGRLESMGQLDAARRVLLGALRELIAGLKALVGPDRYGNTIAGIRARLNFARALAKHAATYRAAWVRAIAAIERLPYYAGIKLHPIEGLAPLGQDPESGLWEFAHLGTGQPPRRSASGLLQVTKDTGVVLVLIPAGRFHMGAHPVKGPNLVAAHGFLAWRPTISWISRQAAPHIPHVAGI